MTSHSPLALSPIIVGLWRMKSWGYSIDELTQFFLALRDAGVTSIDLADIYGRYECEAIFGEVLTRAPELRQHFQLISKCGVCQVGPKRPAHYISHYNSSASHMVSAVDSSLQALRTDYLDMLLIHRPDFLMDADETAGALTQLVNTGKVKHIGVSNFLPSQINLLQSRLNIPLEVNQIKCSLLHTAPLVDGQLDYCQEKRIAPMAWSPFAGGQLWTSDDAAAVRLRDCLHKIAQDLMAAGEPPATPDQIALAWLLKHPSGIKPVIGSGKIERIISALGSVKVTLSHQQWYELLRAARGHEVA